MVREAHKSYGLTSDRPENENMRITCLGGGDGRRRDLCWDTDSNWRGHLRMKLKKTMQQGNLTWWQLLLIGISFKPIFVQSKFVFVQPHFVTGISNQLFVRVKFLFVISTFAFDYLILSFFFNGVQTRFKLEFWGDLLFANGAVKLWIIRDLNQIKS